MKKNFITGLLLLVTSVICQAQLPEVGIYISPLGGGYSQIQYNHNVSGNNDRGIIPLKGRGFNGTSTGFITLKFDRLRLGAEASYIFSGYSNFTNVSGINEPEGTNWRNTYTAGGRIGYDIVQTEIFALSPTFSMGTFRMSNDDFIENPTRRIYHKASLLFEYKPAERLSLFAEPNFHNFRYIPAGTVYKGRMYNYNLNIGVGFRL